MEPVTIFMLTVTVGALARSISKRLIEARNINQHLHEFADDLRALHRVVVEVSALLDQPLIEQTLNQPPLSRIIVIIKTDFEGCQKFIEDDLSRMKNESTSVRSRIKHFTGAKRASTELRRTLKDHIKRAQLGLQILNLCVKPKRPNGALADVL